MRNRCAPIVYSGLCLAAVLFGTNGVLSIISTNLVSSNSGTDRWEPSTGVGSIWATSWAELTPSPISLVGNWNNGWANIQQLRAPGNPPPSPPGTFPTGDVYLAWDSNQNHFVFVGLDLSSANPFNTNPKNVWFGTSDSTGTVWTFNATPVMAADNSHSITWDYPSVGVDASGRIIVGAVKFTPGDAGFWTAISVDHGAHFSAVTQVGSSPGALSRVVATDTKFEAFFPALNGSRLPTAVYRFESTDHISWTSHSVATFTTPPMIASPVNYSTSCPNPNQSCGCTSGNSPRCGPIYYAAYLDARGYTNGLWTVAFPINDNGWNNIYTCTSSRACGVVNEANGSTNPPKPGDDQFLGATYVSGDSGYWYAYYTYTTPGTRPLPLPLMNQAIYFAPGAIGTGITLQDCSASKPCIDPKQWYLSAPSPTICGSSVWCFGAGDYSGLGSTPSAGKGLGPGSSVPFVRQSGTNNALFQTFVLDPQAITSTGNFVPNFVPYPEGADLSALAGPVPPQVGHRASLMYLLSGGDDRSNELAPTVGPYPNGVP